MKRRLASLAATAAIAVLVASALFGGLVAPRLGLRAPASACGDLRGTIDPLLKSEAAHFGACRDRHDESACARSQAEKTELRKAMRALQSCAVE